MAQSAVSFEGLSTDERLDLLERLWNSLTPADVPVTAGQRQELDRRLDALDSDIDQGQILGVPWDQVLEQIRSRR